MKQDASFVSQTATLRAAASQMAPRLAPTAVLIDNRPSILAQRQVANKAALAFSNSVKRQFTPPAQRKMLGGGLVSSAPGKVVQLKKIGGAIRDEIEAQLAYLMYEVFGTNTAEYNEASSLFDCIDEQTHDHDAKKLLEDATTNTGSLYFSQIATLVVEGGVRANFYPSGFVKHAKQAQIVSDTANTHHANGLIKCPGYKKPAHYVASTTIDHVVPVSYHWNNTGYQTDKATRRQWYNDTANHEYLCQPCNSSKGGQVYTKAPDYANGFSH